VKELRDEKGWNQTVLGYHAGLSPSQISLIENGKRNPSAETLQGIATALGVEVGDLFPKVTVGSERTISWRTEALGIMEQVRDRKLDPEAAVDRMEEICGRSAA
jgi:transcriptional regulator with XRE-family HTH domain